MIIDRSGAPLSADPAPVERNYRAATTNDHTPLPVPSGSGNAVMEHARGKLKDWGRNLEENHDLSAQAIYLKARAMTRLELVPMARSRSRQPAEELNRALRDLWQEWRHDSDAMELNPWWRHCHLIGATTVRDGECFLRHFQGDVRSGRRVHYSIAAYEMDFVPFDLTLAVGERALAPGHRIVHGIEVDAVGRPAAVWMYPEHPGGMEFAWQLNDLIRVPIDQITHLRHSRRLGQYRGASVLAPSLMRLANIDDYEASEQFAAKVAGAVAVQLVRSPDAPTSVDLDTTTGARTMAMQPGMMLDNLAPGEKWEVVDTSRPNPELTHYRKSQLQAATAGCQVSYSETTNDYSGTYSSQRQELVTTRQWYTDDQDYWRGTFMRQVYRRFVSQCILQAAELRLARLVERADPASLFEFDATPESQPMIDKARETKGDRDEIEMGTESRHGVIRRRGRDPERVDRERANDVQPALAAVPDDANQVEDPEDAEA